MAVMFDTDRLQSGRKEVKEIYEMADMLGVDVIKVHSKKSSASTGSIANFEIGAMGFDGRGGMNSVTTVKGYLYLYPDKHNVRWGFVLDTEYNRKILASHIAAPVIKIADRKVLGELIEYCDKNGINVKPEAAANPYAKKSITEERLEKSNEKLEADLRQAQVALKLLMEQKEDNDRALLRKEQYRDSNTDNTVTELEVDPITGEGVEVDVEATTQALEKPSAKTKKVSKATKPLAGKKANKK